MGRRKSKGEKRGNRQHGYRRPGRYYEGQPLWELLANLPDYGVGRLIVRGSFKQNEDQPTYMRILEVDYAGKHPNKKKAGKFNLPVKVERILRGVVIPKTIDITSTSYMPDFNLVPKEDEEKLLNRTKTAEEKGYIYWTAAQKKKIRKLVEQGIPILQAKQMVKESTLCKEEEAAKHDGTASKEGPSSSDNILYDDNFDEDDEPGNETDESADSDNGPPRKAMKIN